MGTTSVGTVGVDLVDREQGFVEGGCGSFDRLATAGQAVDDGHDPDDLEALLADALDRGDGGAAAGDRVLDDEAAVAGSDRALNPALQAVLLALAADEEADQVLASRDREGGAGRAGSPPVAGPPTAVAPASIAAAAISSPAARKPAGRSSARRAST